MPKVVWSADNDRKYVSLTRKKLLIRLIDRSAKSYDSESLAQLFEGATPKAIEERIAKLKREAKALGGPTTGKTSCAPSSAGKKGKRKRSSKNSKTNVENKDDEEEESLAQKKLKTEEP